MVYKVLLIANAVCAVWNMAAENWPIMFLNITGFLALIFTMPTLPENEDDEIR